MLVPIEFVSDVRPKALYFTFVQAVEAFNRGDFYDAHEYFEEIWKSITSEEKEFFQGLVQLATGFYHWSNANSKGAYSLLNKGVEKLKKFDPTYHGLEVKEMLKQVNPFLQILQTIIKDEVKSQQFHPMQFHIPYPRIEWNVLEVRKAFGVEDRSSEDVFR